MNHLTVQHALQGSTVTDRQPTVYTQIVIQGIIAQVVQTLLIQLTLLWEVHVPLVQCAHLVLGVRRHAMLVITSHKKGSRLACYVNPGHIVPTLT